ncbi:galactokinase [Cohaesibacter sp. CAU 1516]|uniref:galactokinase n=1 Tax=Cohaesibacter sp. CAU 1516 TaxID=2576038 RepID=UPI0010FF5E46|nr:galactokinase [Cohaesibacter sp. CAU 1516]TLP46232.1 galactokinase [Cohaesibacter sp. CAU 1516]
MSHDSLIQSVSDAYEAQFGTKPAHVTTAPGRVNLLGEHTDYNGGYVLPMPLTLEVCIAIGPGDKPGFATLYSQSFDEICDIALKGSKSNHWSDFILGSFQLSEHKPDLNASYRLAIGSSLPMGAGISSSAALEVVSLRAIAAYLGVSVDPVAIAHTARKVENEFVGMPCGIMDQFASSVGAEAMALFLDARSMEYELAPLFPDHKIITLHSGVTHKLTDGSYEQRVKECASACAMLGINQLRDVGMEDLDRIEALGGVETRRARHIVTENQRVLDGVAALKAHDAATFGRLMVESHASQRNDYAITVAETDALVEAALAAGAKGARQTGGGFGGAIVALVADDQVDAWCEAMTRDHPETRILDVT